jgi:hypothetical protein
MNESEAITKASAVIRTTLGKEVAPTHPAEFRSVGGRRSWTVYYRGLIVTVNDKTGDVSVFENPPKKK